MKRSTRRAIVSIGPAALAASVAHEAAANPPPPNVLPDPPITAPTKDEAPSVVRKHATVCYAFYPSGGTLVVDCPPELANEPLGEALLKNPSGRCQFVPLLSGGPGRTGYLEKCPPVFDEVAKADVVPERSKKFAEQLAAAQPTEARPMDPPQPARLESAPPQQVGCTGCATATGRASIAQIAACVAAVAVARRRRRASRR